MPRPTPCRITATTARPLRIAFVGQAVDRKGLPVLLRAFEALREHIPAELTIVGAEGEDIDQVVLDDAGIFALGKVSDDQKWAALRAADVLCAPSLGGESFGMVLTEAFAAGTPSWPRTSPATATWSATARTACSCPAATPSRWPRRCATSGTSPSGAPSWRTAPQRAPSATPGRGSQATC